MVAAADVKAIRLGHPSYVWRSGQDRRLNQIRQYVALEGRKNLDIGCGLGMYVDKFRRFSDEVYGVDVDEEKVAQASEWLPNIQVAPGEHLPFADGQFDVILLNEVIEHVDDDRRTAHEMVRVTRPGGSIDVFAPNRLYPFETHGAYIGGRYVFGNIPLVNWLPDPLRDRFSRRLLLELAHLGDFLFPIDLPFVGLGHGERELARQQVVARVAIGHADDVAAVAEIVDGFLQDDFNHDG